MHPLEEYFAALTRRAFFARATAGIGLGGIALAALEAQQARAAGAASGKPLSEKQPHFAPRAKNVIYLHMAGSPPQHETFDYKPHLAKLDGKDADPKLFEGKTFAFIKGTPKMLGPRYKFKQHGQSGAWVSETLPHIAS
ncbi:MAG: DUF1501 domain-containing protein, partial [Planctomycetota bacterium]|nr:DUF1501 domain-containing protein [Planctomycetota bacterium]